MTAAQVLNLWKKRHGEKWRERGVRHAARWASIVIANRFGTRRGLSRGPWTLGTGDLNGRKRSEVDQERRDEIKDEVDALLDELGMSKPEDPLRRVGPAMRDVVVKLDEADGPLTPHDLDLPHMSYDAKRGAFSKLIEHGFAKQAGERQFTSKNNQRRLIMQYAITDEGREIAKLVREREVVTV